MQPGQIGALEQGHSIIRRDSLLYTPFFIFVHARVIFSGKMLDDEESLMDRFNMHFWNGFISESFPEFKRPSSELSLTSDIYIEKLKELLADARSASVTVSANEELDDLQTSALLFCLIPFALGYSLYYRSEYIPEFRFQLIQEVVAYWKDFLRVSFQLNLIQQTDMSCRTSKIDAVKRQFLLKDSIKKVSGAKNIDDSRAEVIDMLGFFAIQCQTEVRFAEEELNLLRLKPETAEVDKNAGQSKKPWSVKIDHTNLRSHFAKSVFRPDITTPTLSLEEFAEQELLKLKAGNHPVKASDSDEDTYYQTQREAEIIEHRKAREWDNWKDDNPRGIGNKMINLGWLGINCQYCM